MEVIYSQQAIKDLNYWKKTGNKAIQKKITDLIKAIVKDPFTGIGKPESLKYEMLGSWSRRINQEHRLVYSVNMETNTI